MSGTFYVLSLLNSMGIIDNSLSLTKGYQYGISNNHPFPLSTPFAGKYVNGVCSTAYSPVLRVAAVPG